MSSFGMVQIQQQQLEEKLSTNPIIECIPRLFPKSPNLKYNLPVNCGVSISTSAVSKN